MYALIIYVATLTCRRGYYTALYNNLHTETKLGGCLKTSLSDGNRDVLCAVIQSLTCTLTYSTVQLSYLQSTFSPCCLQLTIEVADTGTPRLTRTGCLNISVEDINDFAPAFSQVGSLGEHAHLDRHPNKTLEYMPSHANAHS